MNNFDTLILDINDLNNAYQKLVGVYNQVGKQLKLSASNISVLNSIKLLGNESTQAVSIKNLHQILGGSRTNLSPRITILLKKGYVLERPDGNDRRTMLIEITPKGEAVLKQASQYFETIPIDENQQIIKTLMQSIEMRKESVK